MLHRLSLLIPLALFSSPLAGAAPVTNDLEREYQQVRKIALRDPQVRAAYEKAERKLAEKIVEIDPALANYRSRATAPTPAARPGVARKPEPVVRVHVVKKGDTLLSISRQYDVPVASLQRANRIADERKLVIGQQIRIEKPRRS